MFFEPSTSTIHPTIQHYAAAHPEAAGLDTEAGRLAAGLHRLHERPPAYDPLTHTLAFDGVELVEGIYHARYTLAALTPEQIQAMAPWRRITRLAFRNRFTMAEKTALELASLDSPAAPMAQRQQSATLRAYLADVAAANYIDLARADTRAGVQMLEQAGLIGAGRALQILDGPVQPDEVAHAV